MSIVTKPIVLDETFVLKLNAVIESLSDIADAIATGGVSPATTETLGVVQIGEGVNVTADGVISVDLPSVEGLASETWVLSQGFLTEHQDISGKADKSVVDAHIDNAGIHVTASDKTAWNGKQDAISDLDDIRDGAELGATAVQPAAIVGMATQTYVTNAISAAIADVDDLVGSGVI